MKPNRAAIENGFAPSNADLSDPLKEEERFATLQRALEDARSEYRLRRVDTVQQILGPLISELRGLPGSRYALLLAAALTLQGRVHLRHADKAQARADRAEEEAQRTQQNAAFAEALRQFRDHEATIGEQSRLWADYGIGLFRTGDLQGAIRILQQARATGATPAEAFAYLGLAYTEIGEFRPA